MLHMSYAHLQRRTEQSHEAVMRVSAAYWALARQDTASSCASQLPCRCASSAERLYTCVKHKLDPLLGLYIIALQQSQSHLHQES